MKSSMSSRLDPYSQQMREEQKALINGLLGIIYDNYDSTRRIQATVDGIYRMTVTILIFVIFLVGAGLILGCYFGCRRYQQSERSTTGASPLHQPRKSVPIEL